MPHRLYAEVAARAGHRCEYCRAPEHEHSVEYEVEHIHPRARGGDDSIENLALACGSCNRGKAQATRAIDVLTGELALRFNPRRHIWAEHFEFRTESVTIVGRTPTGRATVERLDLNRRQMIRARLLWGANGWFPT